MHCLCIPFPLSSKKILYRSLPPPHWPLVQSPGVPIHETWLTCFCFAWTTSLINLCTSASYGALSQGGVLQLPVEHVLIVHPCVICSFTSLVGRLAYNRFLEVLLSVFLPEPLTHQLLPPPCCLLFMGLRLDLYPLTCLPLPQHSLGGIPPRGLY